MASRIRHFALFAGLIAAAAMAISANSGQGGAWARDARQAPGARPAKESPPFKTFEVRLLAKPKGDRNAELFISTATVERMPKTITYSTGDADLVLKADKKDSSLYSTLFHIDLGNLRDQASTELEFLQNNTFPPPPRRSARFGLLPSRGSSALPPKVAIANIRAGLSDFDDLQFQKASEISLMKLVLLRGDIRATLFERPVPMGTFNDLSPQILPNQIVPERSLMIRDLAVTADPARTYDLCGNSGNPNGVWTFKHVMTAMANQPVTGIAPEQFTLNWLTTFASAQTINGNPSAARPNFVSVVRDHWLAISGGSTLDLDKAPFRLLAIVSRSDIHGTPGGYGSASAGEARLVFGILDPTAPCGAQQSTVIFEYGIHKPSCVAVKAWIQAWADLSNAGLVLGGSFNTQLQILTESFVAAGADSTQFPNGSSISQVRVDDLIGGPWTLYEFRLDQSNLGGMGQLNRSTVKMTPDITFHSDPSKIAELASYINANAAGILAGTNTIPPSTPASTPFLGAEAPDGVPPSVNNANFTWTDTPFVTPPATATVRSAFSLGTCNGCHTGDGKGEQGQVTFFTHVKPRPPGVMADLSGFVFDPTNDVFFQDDLERRQLAMATALNSSCPVLPIFTDQLINAQD